MERWESKRVLVLGMTYPSYSVKYTENVCTGGLEEQSLKMVRMHPIPHRYLEPENRFRSFQWIKAKVGAHPSDPRPESLRVEPDSIEPAEDVPATKYGTRRDLLERSPHRCRSIEELTERQKKDGTSLGTVVPKAIMGFAVEMRDPGERDEWARKEKEILGQQDLFRYHLKPLDFPEAQFKVKWECDDPRCQTHEMALLQWGIHELYRKLKNDPDRDAKVLAKMKEQLDHPDKDVFLFVGNFRERQYQFGLMDSYSAPKERMGSLFP